jgi:predicted metallo-beta-lactamase superfamily hydrolase
MTWLQEREVPTVEDAFANLRQILQEEDYELTLPERVDRSNSFSEVLDELSD